MTGLKVLITSGEEMWMPTGQHPIDGSRWRIGFHLRAVDVIPGKRARSGHCREAVPCPNIQFVGCTLNATEGRVERTVKRLGKACWCLLLASLCCNVWAGKTAWPVARGSFIQEYLVRDWSDADWRREFHSMQDVGMDIIVFGCTADSKKKTAFYPTRVPGYRQAEGYHDAVGKCLAAAKATGMKVVVGLNFAGQDWFRKGATDPEWLYDQMRQGNAIADDLYKQYHAKYPATLWGWYWVWEADNLNFRTSERADVLAHALDLSVSHLHALAPHMPVMLCPFMNAACGPPEEYAATWKHILAKCSLGRGDIFAPQDSCGAGGLNVQIVGRWFAALKTAVDTKPGLRLWSDTETFNQADWTAAELNRFVSQLKAIQPSVSGYVTFAYCHYYSPQIVDPGFQTTLKQYVRTGHLDSTPPTEPSNLTADRGSAGVSLSWSGGKDNIGVCGYYVYRDGERVKRTQRPRKYEHEKSQIDRYLDVGPAAAGAHVYAVQTYDFAGNVSGKVTVNVK